MIPIDLWREEILPWIQDPFSRGCLRRLIGLPMIKLAPRNNSKIERILRYQYYQKDSWNPGSGLHINMPIFRPSLSMGWDWINITVIEKEESIQLHYYSRNEGSILFISHA